MLPRIQPSINNKALWISVTILLVPLITVTLWSLIFLGRNFFVNEGESLPTAPDSGTGTARNSNDDIPFELSLNGDSDLKLRTYSDNVVEAGRLLELGAEVANPEPITDAQVLVSIERPSGSKIVMPLLDDGLHGDGFADDGYYSTAFYDTFQSGMYRLEYNVEGVTPDGLPFTRLARRTVEVRGDAGQGTFTLPLEEGLNLIGLDGLAPVNRNPRNAFLSISGSYTHIQSYKFPVGTLLFKPDSEEDTNTLKEIDPHRGYWIRTTEPVTLEVAGPSLGQNHYIPIHPGWNLVPYLTAATLPITEALSSIDGQYLGIRSFKNGAMSYWPQLPESMNTLNVMKPGLAYWILMPNVHTILQYPEYVGGPPSYSDQNDKSDVVSLEGGQQMTSSNQPQNVEGVTPTERWVDFYSFKVTVNGNPAPQGSVISVFDPRARKVGETIVETPGWVGLLSVYGDSDFTEEVDGALPDDTLEFRINGEAATPARSSDSPVKWTHDGDLIQLKINLD